MTTTVKTATDVAGEPVPAAVDRAPRRFTGRQLLVVTILALIGALVAAWAVYALNDRREVLVVAQDAPIGTRITEDHLTTMLVAADPGAALIDAAETDDIIGRYAATGLTEGMLLAPGHVTETALDLEDGTEQVGIGLAPDQLPAEHLQAGWSVTVVDTTGDETAAGSTSADAAEPTVAAPRSFPAVVVGTAEAGSTMTGTTTVVYLAVDADQAAVIVTLAASGNVALTLRSGE